MTDHEIIEVHPNCRPVLLHTRDTQLPSGFLYICSDEGRRELIEFQLMSIAPDAESAHGLTICHLVLRFRMFAVKNRPSEVTITHSA